MSFMSWQPAPAGHPAENLAWVGLEAGLQVQTLPLHDTRTAALDQHIHRVDELESQLDPLVRRQIEGDRVPAT
jgi:hypothetical protein